LHWLKQIETEMGRVASVRYGPRLIDIDLLIYGDQILNTETLTLPHPRMFERAFVLVPFAELAPNLIPPTSTRTIAELCRALDSSGIRQLEDRHG
jgi:7,8-dihydro-6-hydroxymethylpterin-pyrophosphokinase